MYVFCTLIPPSNLLIFVSGTYCQQREVEAITEGVEDNESEWLELCKI